ncbi:ABC transporter substrate-binding protein [Candidatus Uhrbacteria bacterium]|nr:ABC transporter substrate-binding protein [Candidatus Uhrbacteria bacterium]
MTKGAKLFWGLVILAVIIVVAAVSRAPRSGPSVKELPEGPIKIGFVAPLTGDGAAYGIPIQRAAELALADINQNGGIGKRQLEVVWEDGKCDPKDATAAAQKLINIDRVSAIFGGVCSSETLAMAPLAEAAKVLVVSPSSTSPDLTAAGEFIFRTAPSDAAAGAIAAKYAYDKMGSRKAAVISETKDYTQGLRQVFTAKFKELGGEVVADETFNTGDTDFRTQILKIKNATPDVIYLLPQTPTPGVLLLQQLTSNGVEAKRLTAEVLLVRSVVDENKAQMEGLIGIEQYFDEQNELWQGFIAAYKTRYSEDPPFPSYQANTYSQFYLLKEAVEKVGLNTEKIRDYFLGLKDWKHTLGTITFDSNGDPVGLPYSIKTIAEGELQELEVFRP